jgi:hypothetical protein
VAEQGTHEDLLAQEDSLYRHYHALQFQLDEGQPAVSEEQPRPPIREDEAWPDLQLPFFPTSDPPAPSGTSGG